MDDLKLTIEAILMSTPEPLTLDKIVSILEVHPLKPTADIIKKTIENLNEAYTKHAFEVKCLASGYIIQTRAAYASWVALSHAEKPTKYSRALLETLAIIAYKQPVTRADIESMRGVVVSSNIMKTLLERGWIRIAGHRDVPGKPAVYITTKGFLDYFNLQHLRDLPPLPEVTMLIEECVLNEQ
jgi:segregation and condensation protein B